MDVSKIDSSSVSDCVDVSLIRLAAIKKFRDSLDESLVFFDGALDDAYDALDKAIEDVVLAEAKYLYHAEQQGR